MKPEFMKNHKNNLMHELDSMTCFVDFIVQPVKISVLCLLDTS